MTSKIEYQRYKKLRTLPECELIHALKKPCELSCRDYFIYAAQENRHDICELILSFESFKDPYVRLRWNGQEGSNAFTAACERSDLKMVKLLWKHQHPKKPLINFPDNNDKTPLIAACLGDESNQDRIKIVKFLLSHGANLEYEGYGDEFLGTPFLHACREENMKIVKYLISQGANFKATGYKNKNALSILANGFSVDLVKYLVSQGVDPNHVDDDGLTPLKIASIYSADEDGYKIIKYLLTVVDEYPDPEKEGYDDEVVEIYRQHKI